MGSASIEEVANLADRQNWPADARVRAYALATRPVEAGEWLRFLNHNLLAGGSLSLLAGILFLVAANWTYLGSFAKFFLLEGLIAGAALYSWRLGLEQARSRWALTVAAGLVGALLTLYGHTYHSDAEAYSLFLTWALLILPWTWLLRFGPCWALWTAVSTTCVLLASHDNYVAGLFNTVLWGLAVFGFPRFGWPQVPLTLAWGQLTLFALIDVLDSRSGDALLAWLVWLVVTSLIALRKRLKGTLAAAGFSVIVLLTTALLKETADWQDFGWLFVLGLAVTVQVSVLIWLLRKVPE